MWLAASGERLFAYTGGRPFDPARPCFVFVHGAQHDHSVWLLQSRYLAHHGYAVLAFDLPGHGASGGAPCGSVEAAADRLAEALAGVPNRTLILVGHSLGSLIVLELARRLHERVAGVALCATAFPMSVSDALLQATRDDPRRALQMINVWSHSASLDGFTVRPSNPGPGSSVVWANLRLMERIARRNGPGVLATDFAACNAYAGGLDAVKSLHCPLLFVLGAQDQMTAPKSAQALIDAAATRTVRLLPRTGHAMMAENPDAVRDALVEFAVGVLQRRAAA
jgi:pimeloyl-ACP methyl ester carboxylesterase